MTAGDQRVQETGPDDPRTSDPAAAGPSSFGAGDVGRGASDRGRGARLTRCVGDLALGVRLAFGGGRASWARLALTALGIGLAVALLLIAACVPNAQNAHQARTAATSFVFGEQPPIAGVDPLYVHWSYDVYRGRDFSGKVLVPGGPHAPVPPGVSRLPGPGEIVLSPALADLLASDDGALLRPRYPQRVIGLIGQDGLSGPNELTFYSGEAPRPGIQSEPAVSVVYRFGVTRDDEALPPVLVLMMTVGVAVLLFPLLVFVAIGARLSGATRDRRLAALRLVGAGASRVRWIAAGEALLSAVLGLLLGVVLFLLARPLASGVEVFDVAVFQSDLVPWWPFALLVLAAVPVLAVLAALVAMRRTVIEPLGVVRDARPVRRRLWWRLLPPVAGALLLVTQQGVLRRTGGTISQVVVLLGVSLLLLTIPVLLPWAVERVVGRMRGGPPAWQLAVRRLQVDSGTSARVVGGIAVVLAGSIAMLAVISMAGDAVGAPRGPNPRVGPMQLYVEDAPTELGGLADRLRGVPGVQATVPVQQVWLRGTDEHSPGQPTYVASCAVVLQMVTTPACADGDVFAVDPSSYRHVGADPAPQPGQRYTAMGAHGQDGPQWTVPAGLRAVKPSADNWFPQQTLLLTPGAAAGLPLTPQGIVLLRVDVTSPDVLERVRNVAQPALGWRVQLSTNGAVTISDQARVYLTLRRLLLACSVLTLVLAGASLLVLAAEQVRERRRPLAVLAASGVPRRTLAGSLLWQNTIPVVVAVLVAVATGLGVGALLTQIMGGPISFDWSSVGLLAGAAVLVVVLATALTLPALSRAIRPTGLRAE